MTYGELLEEASMYNVHVKEKQMLAHDGLCKGNKIAIRKNIPTLKEKACVLAEELGHYHLTVGNILNQSNVSNRKQERLTRYYAYNKQIGIQGIIRAYEAHCKNLFEIADYLDVTESFLNEALTFYRSKYGEYLKLDNYIIYFEPNLAVMKIM